MARQARASTPDHWSESPERPGRRPREGRNNFPLIAARALCTSRDDRSFASGSTRDKRPRELAPLSPHRAAVSVLSEGDTPLAPHASKGRDRPHWISIVQPPTRQGRSTKIAEAHRSRVLIKDRNWCCITESTSVPEYPRRSGVRADLTAMGSNRINLVSEHRSTRQSTCERFPRWTFSYSSP